jgi:DNA polymerase III epsilon subunit-like protein
MHKHICFLYTETTGLHQTNEAITKKNLFNFARLVILNYELGYYKDGVYIQEKKVRTLIKPVCFKIPEETTQYHGITQKYANKKGENLEETIMTFKNDLKNIDVIISHNIDFHLKTVLAEALKCNIQLDFNNFIIIDTISFYHKYEFIKLINLAQKLSIKNIFDDTPKIDIIRDVFLKLYKKFKKSCIN